MKTVAYFGLFLSFALAGTAPVARAGTYDVSTCADAADRVNNSWSPHNNDVGAGQLETGRDCNASGTYAGLYARDALTCGATCSPVPNSAAAGWIFRSPPGTTITKLVYSRWFYKMDDEDWAPALVVDGVPSSAETCTIVYPAYSCTAGSQDGAHAELAFPSGVSTLDLGVSCTPNPSNNCVAGATLHRVGAVLYGATVTLSDPSAPTLSHLGGGVFGGGYLRGPVSGSFDASDNSGIRSSRFYLDGVGLPSVSYSCDFTYVVPCGNKTGAQLALDTRGLSDGSHSLQVAVTDAAGNETRSAARSITVDNAAPAAPLNMAAAAGSDWQPDNSFSVSWTNPPSQTSAIAAAHYQACATDGSGCGAEQVVRAAGIQHLDAVSVPATGSWTLRVWLEDAAGNVDPAQSADTTLRFGSAPTSSSTTTSSQVEPTPSLADSPVAPTPTDQLASGDGTGGQATCSQPTCGLAPTSTTSRRISAHLRITSARLRNGRVTARGRIAARARGRMTLRLRLTSGRTLRRTVSIHHSRFAITLRARGVHKLRGALLARYAGNATFAPARATLHL